MNNPLPDPDVAARLHLYNAAFHLKYRVPVRSILVLLRPKAQTAGLTGKLSYVCGGNRVNFQYDVVRLWRESVQPFPEGGLGLLPLAPLCKMPAGKPLDDALRDVVRAMDRRLADSADHVSPLDDGRICSYRLARSEGKRGKHLRRSENNARIGCMRRHENP
jgi:hypothetical protein